MWRSSPSTQSSLQMSPYASEAEPRRHPAEKSPFVRLNPQSNSFSHNPRLMIAGEGQVAFQLIPLLTTTVQCDACIAADASPNPPVLHPALTRAKEPEILKLLHLGQQLTLHPEREPCPRTWRFCISPRLFHIRLQTTLLCIGMCGLHTIIPSVEKKKSTYMYVSVELRWVKRNETN